MKNVLSDRVAGLKPSGIRKFFDIAATMKDVISLGIGEPDFDTPKPIIQARKFEILSSPPVRIIRSTFGTETPGAG